MVSTEAYLKEFHMAVHKLVPSTSVLKFSIKLVPGIKVPEMISTFLLVDAIIIQKSGNTDNIEAIIRKI